MGDLFWNKIIGAVLATLLVVFGFNEISHMLVHPHELEEPAYPIEVPEEGGSAVAEAEEAVDLGTALAAANPTTGATFARTLCGSCHTFEEGGPTLTGPNLYGVVGRPVASEDFNYTPAMREFGGEWTYDRLWTYLGAPQRVVPGTAMVFAGLAREDQRANVIAYLSTLAADPVAFPEPAPAEAAPAEGEAGEGEAGEEAAGEQTGEAPAEAGAVSGHDPGPAPE